MRGKRAAASPTSEAHPKPDIAMSEELATAAEVSGRAYPERIQRIVELGLRRAAGR